jgi:bacterial/archaeal transporter family-2 protein
MNLAFALMAALAGAAGTIQSAANAGLAARIGLAPALLVNTAIVLLGTLAFYFSRGPHQGAFFATGAPWTLYVGGVCGFAVILSLAFVFPKIGAAVAIALVVLGQGAAALAIDHFGWMDMPVQPITALRVAGLLLVGGGIALIRA